jgi:signal transduction histidine kinase
MILHAIIFGAIFFQVIYVFMQWLFFRRKEFINYILYVSLFLLFLYAYYEPQLGITNFFDNNKEKIKTFTRIEGMLIFYSYVVFTRYFTDVKYLNPKIELQLKNIEKFLLIGFVSQIFFALICTNNNYREFFSWVFFIPGFFWAIKVGIRLLGLKSKLNNFIIIGSLFAITGSFTQAIIDNYSYFFLNNYHTGSLIMEIGFVMEFIFLNLGFLYKTKQLQMQQIAERDTLLNTTIQKNEISNQLQDVRNKLAMDLHDDVSSSLGSIHIISKLLLEKSETEPTKNYATKIHTEIKNLTQKINVLVWSFNEKNDTIESFIEYIHQFTDDFLEHTLFKYTINTKIKNGSQLINGNIRKNLFLCIKECIHNAVKHSKGSKITIDINTTDLDKICICIQDDGIGFNPKSNAGNGLLNIGKRMQSINGTVQMDTANSTNIKLKTNYLG